MKLYQAIVRSVLLYNSCTWGMSTKDENEMDNFQRRQLRSVLGVRYPTTMRNEAVYKLTKSRPISIDITKSRWKMFGHALPGADPAFFKPGVQFSKLCLLEGPPWLGPQGKFRKIRHLDSWKLHIWDFQS